MSMNIFNKIAQISGDIEYQSRAALCQELQNVSPADIEVGVNANLKSKNFVDKLFSLIDYGYQIPQSLKMLSEDTVTKLYKVADKKKSTHLKALISQQELSEALVDGIAEAYVEACAKNGNGGGYWHLPELVVNHKNFSLQLEKKMVASPKKYRAFYESLAEKTKDEKHLVKICKHIKDSWALRKAVKRALLSHASLEKIAETSPESVVYHSKKLTPEFLDTMALSNDRDVRSAVVVNPKVRESTLRKMIVEADPDKDFQMLRNVVYNKKAPVDIIAIAFGKVGDNAWIIKEFCKRKDFVAHIRTKLAE